MATMWNLETQQVDHDVSLSQQAPPPSSQSDDGRNKDSDNQPAGEAIQNVEAPPAFGDGVRVQDPNQQTRRVGYSRHTQYQIKEMESFFKECPHPDEKQKREIGNMLGLSSSQVQYWFQNKRTQMKGFMERHKKPLLIAENDKLCAENLKYKGALSNAKCLDCRSQPSVGEFSYVEQHLRLENNRLKEAMAAKNAEKHGDASISNVLPPTHTPTPSLSHDVVNYVPQPNMEVQLHGGSDPQRSTTTTPFTESEKAFAVKLAANAMEEFTKMVHGGAPLWIPGMHGEILNQQEYVKTFPFGLGPRPLGFRSEASRDSKIVIMNPNNLIEILMDVNQWSTLFAGIVSRARITEILSTGGPIKYDGALQVMSAEFQVLSHIVPTRNSYFLRYCKHHPDGAWAVVDISLDYMRPDAATRCKRRPSGCMIQELSNVFSQVTWIEHVDVEDIEVHNLFKHLVNSGFAFGARRWIGTFERQCERLACTMTTNLPPRDISGISLEERKSLMNLAEKIMQSYCKYVGASPPAHVWTVQTTPAGVDDVRVMTRNHSDASGALIGLVISATISFSLPVPSKRLFDFLQNEKSRNQWDILTNGFLVQEMAHIPNGCDPGNFVSLLHANSANASESSKIIIQENCTDDTGSYVVYAPVELGAMNLVLSGSNPDYSTLLPSGFVILPNGPRLSGGLITDVGFRGCLGTFAYQILVEASPTPLAPSIVSTMCNLMKSTLKKVQVAMSVST